MHDCQTDKGIKESTNLYTSWEWSCGHRIGTQKDMKTSRTIRNRFFAYVRSKTKLASAPAALVTDQDVLLDNPYEVYFQCSQWIQQVLCFGMTISRTFHCIGKSTFHPGEQEELTDLHFTEVHVLKSLKTDNVQGPDNISAKLLATTADLLARPV